MATRKPGKTYPEPIIEYRLGRERALKAYAELASYYGCLVDPARAYHPRDYPEDSVIPSLAC